MTNDFDAAGNESWFTVLTPDNRGAIAILRVWGAGALSVANAVFRPSQGSALSPKSPGRLRLGRVGDGLGDEVVAVVLADQHHPDRFSVEFQCHGGPAAWELVARAIESAGASRVNREDWARSEFESPIRSAAWTDLSKAKTVRVAEILLDQVNGALDGEIREILRSLEVDPGGLAILPEMALDTLLRRADLGLRLISGWRIVLAGRPNVGKSSLLNALAGYKRSIVDATPGTTRDIITLPLAVDGWPIELSDTAGLRQTSESLERIGIDRAIRAQERADLVLPIVDRSEALTALDLELIRAHAGGKLPIVASKTDLPAAWSLSDVAGETVRMIELSVRDGSGIDTLIETIGSSLVDELIPPGGGVPFRQNQRDGLRDARTALERGNRPKAAQDLRLLIDRSANGAISI